MLAQSDQIFYKYSKRLSLEKYSKFSVKVLGMADLVQLAALEALDLAPLEPQPGLHRPQSGCV